MTTPLEESYRWCQNLTRRSAGNFYYSFLSLPKNVFRDMCALYAFMRVTDDLADSTTDSIEQKKASLKAWRSDLLSALDDPSLLERHSSHAVFPALAEMSRQHSIASELLTTVIDGVAGDLTPRTFDTFDDLKTYCYQVAGVVGLCCIRIWGYNDPKAEAAAIDCGVAFQLTNILRDLAEDAGQGRVYLPQDDLKKFNYSLDDIIAGRNNDNFQALMKHEALIAETYYQRSATLADYLEPVGQPIYAAMHAIYHELLDEMTRRHFDVYSSRVSVSRWKKVRFAIKACPRYRRLTALTRLVMP